MFKESISIRFVAVSEREREDAFKTKPNDENTQDSVFLNRQGEYL